VVHSSTTTREKPSMIGMESRTNSFRPGSEKSSRGEKERTAAPRAVDLQGEVPEKRPGENPPGEPLHPRSRPRSSPPAMIPAL